MSKEYICNSCGAEFFGPDKIEEAECTECHAMDCQEAYVDIENEH